MLCGIFIFIPFTVISAASDLYITNKADVPVWSEASSKSTQIRKLPKDALVTITSTKINSAGNPWGKTVNGSWIYMGNLNKSNKSLPSTGTYVTNKNDVPLRTIPASGGKILKQLSTGTLVTIKSTFYNDVGNPWGNTSDGYVIYMGNLTKHVHVAAACSFERNISYANHDANKHKRISYHDEICSCGAVVKQNIKNERLENHTFGNNGVCTSCGYEFQLKSVPHMETMKAVADGTKVRKAPYGIPATEYKTIGKDSLVQIISMTTNSHGNLWYKTNDGYWIYSENLTKVIPAKCSHKYDSAGKCSLCGEEFKLQLTANNTTMYIIADKTKIRTAPYGIPETEYKLANSGDKVKIAYQTVNSAGNTWYKTNDGYWIYSGNLTTKAPITECRHNNTPTKSTIKTVYEKHSGSIHKAIKTVQYKCPDCGIIIKTENIETEEAHDFKGDQCTKCGFKRDPLPSIGDYRTIIDDVPLRYEASAKGDIVKTIPKTGTVVKITSTFYNEVNNPWGKTSDGYIIYMGNLIRQEFASINPINPIINTEPINIRFETKNIDLVLGKSRKIKINFDRVKTGEDKIDIVSTNKYLATATIKDGYLVVNANKNNDLRVGEAEIIVSATTKMRSNRYIIRVNLKPPTDKDYKIAEINEKSKMVYAYNDNYFDKAPILYNPEMAELASVLMATVYNEKNIKKVYTDIGFNTNVKTNYFKWNPQDPHTAAYIYGEHNNKDLAIITIRGTSGGEWYSNFDIAFKRQMFYNEHYGFLSAMEKIYNEVKPLLAGSNKKVLITGHSRGAAVANLLSERLMNSSVVNQNNLFAYTFATPNVTKTPNKRNNIFNFANNDDFVTLVPLAKWQYQKHGITRVFDVRLQTNLSDPMKTTYSILTEKNFKTAGKNSVANAIKSMHSLAPTPQHYYMQRNDLSLYKYCMSGLATIQAKDNGDYLKSMEPAAAYTLKGEACVAGVSFVTLFNNTKDMPDYANLSTFFVVNSAINRVIVDNHATESYIGWIKAINKNR